MREDTKVTKVYSFDELSDKAKQKAIEWYGNGNVDYEWYENIYDDAKSIGLKITEFDTYIGNYLKGSFFKGTEESARLILENHGETCDTYILAKSFLDQWVTLNEEDNENGVAESLCVEFERAIKEEYLHILRKEYEYLTSEEQIIESIKANECEFTEEGKVY